MPKQKEITQPVDTDSHNLTDYENVYTSFRWKEVEEDLTGLPDGAGFNIAYEAVDRHASGIQEDKVALRWIGKEGARQEFSYKDLKEQTNRFANVLQSLGLQKDDVVCTLTGRIPELYNAALGTLKNGSVYCPLFSIYGPEPIYQRLSKGRAKVLVTTKALFEKRISGIWYRLDELKYILLTDITDHQSKTVRSLQRLMMEASPVFSPAVTDPEDRALLHFTSGTTGMPKGVIHVHNAALTHYVTGKYVLDFHSDDIFWCTADPGWVTGTSYGILSPLMHGITNLVVEAEFDAQLWYHILENQKVTVWYTAPTAIRRLMRMNIDVRKEYDLSALRLIHSVGEPLNPEAVRWAEKNLGMPILDNWWQTETGGIMIANYPSMPIRPGSMGKPMPGVEAAIVDFDEDRKNVRIVTTAGESGHLALKKGWPSMFRGYLDDEERYQESFIGDWYLTGDLASRDEDGYFWFVGRADDIIKTAGHMVGPFEVENVLMEHPAIAETAVIGKPDPVMGELVKAFVTLKINFEPSEELNLELKGYMRQSIATAMSRSNKEIPHYYLETDIDMKAAVEWLTDENKNRSVSERLLPPMLLIKAVANTLSEVPQLNGFWTDEAMHIEEGIHVGFAISLRQGGLVIPAILNADLKSLDEIRGNFVDMVNRARDGHLRSREISSATITITSLGERGAEKVYGVIYPPQVALLGFGKITDRPCAIDGSIGIRPVLSAVLAGDHRASDGHTGSRFLEKLNSQLQHPEAL